MIPDPDVVRNRESYQTKCECIRIRILESRIREFLCGPQIRIESVPYGTDPLLRIRSGYLLMCLEGNPASRSPMRHRQCYACGRTNAIQVRQAPNPLAYHAYHTRLP